MGRKPKNTKTTKTTVSPRRKKETSPEQLPVSEPLSEPLTELAETAGEGRESVEGGEVEEEAPIVVLSREAVQEVLETVARMPYPGVGMRTIAGILRGETRANWLSFIARTESWGAFFPNPLPVVEAFLRELVRAGYLEGSHFVRLTEQGQRVLEGLETPVNRRQLKMVSRKVRPLLWKLLLLRARLVNEGKAPGLFKDEVLLQLLEKQPTNLKELKRLKGVGKFILQRLGKEIVQIIREFRAASEKEP